MAVKRSVDQGFAEFLETLVPRFSETDAAARNLALAERCLTDAFEMSYLVPFGSTGHGTNVDGCSAIDCFAVIARSRLKDSADASLEAVHESLAAQFEATSVTQGRPFVSVPFGDGPAQRHNLVPAYPIGKKGDHDVFGIPGPGDRWIEACPGGHSAWINKINQRTGMRLKPFVRLAKAWSYLCGMPIWSFYLELRAAAFLQDKSSVSYASDLMVFFRHMASLDLEPFEGSVGSNEPVYGSTVDGRRPAVDALRRARDTAAAARACEAKGDIADAFHQWRKLYNWNFPVY